MVRTLKVFPAGMVTPTSEEPSTVGVGELAANVDVLMNPLVALKLIASPVGM